MVTRGPLVHRTIAYLAARAVRFPVGMRYQTDACGTGLLPDEEATQEEAHLAAPQAAEGAGARTVRFTLPSLADLDRMKARDRVMLERMPSEVREEWERLINLPLSEDDELDPADEARMDEILEQYEDAASEEDIARHVADIVREREVEGTASEP